MLRQVVGAEPDVLHVSAGYRGVKRAIDVAGAVGLLVVSSPVLLVVAALVKATSRGPVLFRQDRISRHGRTFRVFKFRSMVADAHDLLQDELYDHYVESGFKLPPGADQRVTRLGRFLRATSLDEFPQLWNVLRGDMSLVGPRPIVPEDLSQYGSLRHCYLEVTPGLTGLWQVTGRSTITYPERCLIDRDYYEQRSLAFDLSILARTPWVVVRRVGAH